MDQRSEYLIQLLEKIGAPLMEAIADVSARQAQENPANAVGDEAKKIAELLAKAVQVSINIGKNMDLASQEDQGESIRVALAALAGSIVAEQYKHSGKVPDDQGLSRAATALQAVMTFSENFVPSEESTQRLKQIKAQGLPVDARQADIQCIQAFIPVVNAIGDFSFGQPEQKLVQEVADRLTKKAMVLRESVFAGLLSVDEQKYTELALLRALATIYSECHRAETRKLIQPGGRQTEAGTASLTPVWNAFDIRAAMLETLGAGLATQGSATATDSKPPAAPQTQPPPQPAKPPTATASTPLSMFAKPKEQAPPVNPPASKDTPPSPEQPPPPKSQQGGSPMSFFKSDDKSEQE